MSEHSEQPPLLHDVDLMLALLKTGSHESANLEDCIRHIRDNLRVAHVDTSVRDDELRGRLASALFKLEKAKLVEEGMSGSYRVTARGRDALDRHPKGVDESVLMEYPEYADFIKKSSHQQHPEDVDALEYQQGYEAFTAGRNYTDNPYSDDSARHSAWKNGWFQASDERGNIARE